MDKHNSIMVTLSKIEGLNLFLNFSKCMFLQRFALAAAELHGALYAVGGFDGSNYLRYFIFHLIYEYDDHHNI